MPSTRVRYAPKEEKRLYIAPRPKTMSTLGLESQGLVDPPAVTDPDALRAELSRRVVGQQEAIEELVRCYTRFRAGLAPRRRPAGIFLLIGPTGSGKTLLATQFAKLVTGSRVAPLRIDCSEYSKSHEIARLTGAPPGYLGHRETQPVLSNDALRLQWNGQEHPIAILLLDEVDKAHPHFWDLLLGIFDNGFLKLGDNQQVDFTNTIFLLTGNTGSRDMQEAITPGWGLGAGEPVTGKKSLGKVAETAARKLMRPEMFNRLDKVITFEPIGREGLPIILELELADLRDRLESQRIVLALTDPVRDLICSEGYEPRYGARHLKRALVQLLEIPLANEIISGRISPGSCVRACLRDAQIIFKTD